MIYTGVVEGTAAYKPEFYVVELEELYHTKNWRVCLRRDIPLIIGGKYRFEGEVDTELGLLTITKPPVMC